MCDIFYVIYKYNIVPVWIIAILAALAISEEKKARLRGLENRVLRRMFGLKKVKIRGRWHNE
jgi:hypothetical protein